MMRPATRVLLTRPKLTELTLPLGLLNCAWLNALKKSAWTPTETLSVMFVLFATLRLKLLNPGPWKLLRAALPSRPEFAGTRVNAVGLKYAFAGATPRSFLMFPATAASARGSKVVIGPTRFGRQ